MSPVNTVTTDHCDVAIIGYGPVGVTAANLLGSQGLKVAVVERDLSIYSRARAISTDEEVLRIWQRIGLAERLKEDMLSDKAIDFVDAQGRSFLSFAPKTFGNGHPPQLFIYQPALEQVLREGVHRYPDVEVLLQHECLRVDEDATGVTLVVRDLTGERDRTVRASYVIAADGGSSATRTHLGVGFEGKTYEDRWVVIDTKVVQEWPEHDRLRFHCDPERPAVDCPTPLGHHRWEFPVLDGDDEAELVTEDAVWRLLARQGIGREQVDILRAVVYSHHVRFADRWRVGRVFLAGDAAHVMPPWIGQGMASGVRDVNNLCWKLAGVISDELDERVLDSYEVERQPHVRAITSKAIFFGRVITERRRAVTALRNPVFRMVTRLPFVGRFLRDGQWFPVSRYPTGFLASSQKTPSGWMIPQPWVLDENGDRSLLDDTLGGGWSVVYRGSRAPLGAWTSSSTPCIELLPPNSTPTPGAVVDTDGTLTDWMKRRAVHALVLRPDGIVYAAAGWQERLAAPPFRGTDRSEEERLLRGSAR